MTEAQAIDRTLPADPPAWVARYIGIPFVERGRTAEGADCWGLVRLVFAAELGIDLPSADTEYRATHGGQLGRVEAMIRREIDRDWQLIAAKPEGGNCPLDALQPHDCFLMRRDGRSVHVGLVVSAREMLHTEYGIESSLAEFRGPDQWPSIIQIRRHRRLAGEMAVAPRPPSQALITAVRSIGGQEGEILRPGPDDVLVTARPRPFDPTIRQTTVLAGATLEEIVERVIPGPTLRRFAAVEIGDETIPRALWARVRPKPGTAVTVRVLPGTGGGQGGQRKNPLRTILSIVVVVLAAIATWYVGGAGGLAAGPVAGALAGAAVSAAGAFLINALVPMPQPNLDALSGGDDSSPTLSLQGTRNTARRYGKIPRAYGRHKRTVDYGAVPYTEIRGSDQYLRILFDLGYGPQKVEAVKIGQTPIENFEDVEMIIREGWPDDPPLTLVGDITPRDEPLQILIDQASGWIQRRSKANCNELLVELDALQGFTHYDDLGKRDPVTAEFAAEWSVADAGVWTSLSDPIVIGVRNTGTLGRPGLANNKPASAGSTFQVMVNHLTGALEINTAISVGSLPICTLFLPREDGGPLKPAVLTDNRSAEMKAAGYFVPTLDLPLTSHDNSITISGGTVIPPPLVMTGNSTNVVRLARSWKMAGGQYDIRIRRLTPDHGSDQYVDKVWWTILRTTTYEPSIRAKGHATIEMVIKASNELQGLVDELNCITTSYLPDWNGTAWVMQTTRNPASAYNDALQGAAAKTSLADTRIDWEELQAWHEENKAKGRCFDAVYDFATTRLEVLKQIAVAGRASYGMRGGLYSVIRDRPQTVPVQQFGPRNSWGFTMHRRFTDAVHGVRARFVNEEKDYTQDERVVYADGYDQNNATQIVDVDLFGIVRPDQVWQDIRYQQAVDKLRPYDYTLYADVEHLVASRGKLVKVSHDVLMVGLAWGRIKAVTKDAEGNVTGLTVDEPLPMEAGILYGLVIRNATNRSLTARPVTVAGNQLAVTLEIPIPAWFTPAEGDLFSFGERGRETLDCIVSEVAPMGDLAAKLTLVDAAPEVHAADQGAIPAYDSKITLPNGPRPPKLQVARVVSDETVLLRQADGSLQSRIVLELDMTGGFIEPPAQIEVLYGRSGEGQPLTRLLLPGNTGIVSIMPVVDKVSYDIAIRALSARGAKGDWTNIDNHTVIGKSTPPFDIATLMRERNDAVIGYPLVPIDWKGFVLRKQPGANRVWETAAPAHDGIWTQTRFPLGALTSGSWTLLAKAIDAAGNLSANAAALMLGLGDPATDNVVETIDFAALGWPGSIANGTVIAGFLQANDDGEAFWPADDNARFWPLDATAVFWQANWLPLSYVATIYPAPDQVPAVLRLVADIRGASWSLEYRPTGSQAPFWSGDEARFWLADDAALFWPPDPTFLAWPGELPVTHQTYEIRVKTAGGSRQGQLSTLKAIIDMPDIGEDLEDVAIAPGGTRLPITKSYRRIKQVPLTLQDDGGTAVSVRIVDKDPVLGPLIQTLDVAGVSVAGTVDVPGLKGY